MNVHSFKFVRWCVHKCTYSTKVSEYINESRHHLNMRECVYMYYAYACRHFITWFSSSAGLIFAKSEKSIRVSCLAISSGSKSKIVKRAEVGLAGNYKT